ncbi:MAG: GyrI-like domain-containing protein [Methanimicrococcus sp.]|nr:GyrI-like domain-containing protein [Methanimicrococcus sp.]
MPKISNIEILEKPEQPILSIRLRTSVQELPKHIGACYGQMEEYLKKEGKRLSGIPFVAFHSFGDMSDMDVEMGFPLAAPLSGVGEIKAGVIPAGIVLSCMYLGPYSQMESLYNEIMAWISENKYEMVLPSYEYYYNGPGVPEEYYLTEICIPIRPAP